MTGGKWPELDLGKICGADMHAASACKARIAELAMPPGSLGRLEDFAVQLAGIRGRMVYSIGKKRIVVCCGDNGVTEEGVSSAPKEVTALQAMNIAAGHSGMSSMAEVFGAEVQVVDFGIETPYASGIIKNCRIRAGTGNIRSGPAMTREETIRAVRGGMELAAEAKQDGIGAVGVGEMGIGNTTTSSAVVSVLTGRPPEEVTGRGGGITDAQLENKIACIRDAIRFNRPDPEDPVDILSKVGGLDLAAMCGVYLGCASERIPAVMDGFISYAAALCAVRMVPETKTVLFPSHGSAEAGYKAAAEELGIWPVMHLGMRLGEGSGCPFGFAVLDAACAFVSGMATFSEIGLSDDYLDPIRAEKRFQE